jgi:hypothetical protein
LKYLTTLPGNHAKEESPDPKFLFTIKKTQEGVSLEGKKGTI